MALIDQFVAGRSPPELYQAYLWPLFATWSEVLIETLPPQGSVLDIACGTGIVSRRIASQPGVDRVAAVDIAEPMIELARNLTEASDGIDFRVADATNIPFKDSSFQSVYCQQGLQFFPDKPQALKEMGRLMDDRARAAISIWTAASDGNPVFGAFERIVGDRLGADLVPFGPFSFGTREQIEDVIREAGLKLVSLERIERLVDLPDPRTLVLFDLLFLGRPQPDGTMWPVFNPDDSTKDDQIEAIIADLTAETAQFSTPQGNLKAPTTAHILVIESDAS